MGPNAPKVAKEQHHFTELLALQPSPFSTDYTPETSTPLSALWDSQLKQEQESIITTNEHPMMRFLTPGDDPAHIARLHLDKANMPYGDVAFIGNRSLVAQRNFDAIKAATEQKQWSLDVHVEEIQQTVDQSQRKPGVR